MQYQSLKKIWISIFIAGMMGYTGLSSAHTGGATLDPEGTIRNFTGQAFITCSDDGNGRPDYLVARIQDLSPPVPGLLVNLQIYKGNKANSITDTVSGDGEPSPYITVHGGPGVYWILVNKTDFGVRNFVLEWHCQTANPNSAHTGTSISVTQLGLPQ